MYMICKIYIGTDTILYTCSPPPAPTLGRLQDVTVGKTRHMGFLKNKKIYIVSNAKSAMYSWIWNSCVLGNGFGFLWILLILVEMVVVFMEMMVMLVEMVFLEMAVILAEMVVITLIPVQDSSSPPHCRSSNTQTPPNHTWRSVIQNGNISLVIQSSEKWKLKEKTPRTIWTSCWGSCRSSGTGRRGGQSWGARTWQSWQSTTSCGGRSPCSTSQTSQSLLPENMEHELDSPYSIMHVHNTYRTGSIFCTWTTPSSYLASSLSMTGLLPSVPKDATRFASSTVHSLKGR